MGVNAGETECSKGCKCKRVCNSARDKDSSRRARGSAHGIGKKDSGNLYE